MVAGDDIINLLAALGSRHVNEKTVLMMNSAIWFTFRKLKDGQGRYLWKDGRLADFPVVFNDHLASTIATGGTPILAGDFSLFTIVEDAEITITRAGEASRKKTRSCGAASTTPAAAGEHANATGRHEADHYLGADDAKGNTDSDSEWPATGTSAAVQKRLSGYNIVATWHKIRPRRDQIALKVKDPRKRRCREIQMDAVEADFRATVLACAAGWSSYRRTLRPRCFDPGAGDDRHSNANDPRANDSLAGK